MALDVEYLVKALREAAKGGIETSLKLVQGKAQTKAPVRSIFRSGRGRSRSSGIGAASPNETMTPSMALRSPQVSHVGRQIVTGIQHPDRAFIGGSRSSNRGVIRTVEVLRGGSAGKIETGAQRTVWFREKVGGSIRGRSNSYAPVVQSPIGRIGGEQLRHWSTNSEGEGVLSLRVIRNPVGGSFHLTDLLSARGRYEVRNAAKRGSLTTGAHGGQVMGGHLREGITVEGPFENGDEVYGFVSASAHDPGRDHNYAKDQEFGSRHNKAQPFLRPALRESKDAILNYERGTLAKAFRGGVRPENASGSAGKPVVIRATVSSVGWGRILNQLLPSGGR